MPLDRTKFSYLAHALCDFCNPIGDAKADHAIALLGELTPFDQGSNALDVGAGKGEWALRSLGRFPVRACAVEPSPQFAEEIRVRAHARGTTPRLSIHQTTAADFVARRTDTRPFDAALCIGSLHAFGTLEDTIRALSALVRPGGMLLMGAGYWRKEPDPEYLSSFGGRADEMGTHASNVEAMLAARLTPLWACTASTDEFEDYEWRYSRAIELHARQHPDDPDVPAMLERSRGWRHAFLKWGRETMGFGLYLARTPK